MLWLFACCGSSLAIVRKLLDHGADLRDDEDTTIPMGFYALDAAITVEHSDMVKLLLEVGADIAQGLGVDGRGALLRTAIDRGLDSMVELPKENGITPQEKQVAAG